MSETPTIIAPITPPGRGAVTVTRMSGPKTAEIVRKVVKRGTHVLSHPRLMVLSEIFGPEGVLDHGLVVYFPREGSFTGEDCAEFHLHGSPYLVRQFLDFVTANGAQLAEAGEFSKRAFLNGRIDLTQAEAIADLIAAETSAQARAAGEQLAGKLSGAVSKLGDPIRDLLAEVEALIDFPEEEIELQTHSSWIAEIKRIQGEIARYLDTFRTGRLVREGADVALVGLPNAGKSSLLNQLVGEDRVIVSPQAGTTRDTVQEHISLEGSLVHLWDTAGIAVATSDQLELAGISKSWQRVARADLVLFVIDGSIPLAEQRELFKELAARATAIQFVCNKADLLDSAGQLAFTQEAAELFGHELLFVSALRGEGIKELKAQIARLLLREEGATRPDVLITTQRHYEALKQADLALEEALLALRDVLPPELVSIHFREALVALESIVGVTHTEDLLGRIFSRFCIGK